MLGLPFSFAHHFMPRNTDAALELYRTHFHPSEYLSEPYAMVACAALAAEDDERARYLSGPARLSMARLRAGRPTRFPTPEEAAAHEFSAAEEQSVSALSGSAAIGGPDTVRAKLDQLIERTAADELMITTMVHDHGDRIRSYELIAETYELTGPTPSAPARRWRHDDDEGRFQRRGVGADRGGPGARRDDRGRRPARRHDPREHGDGEGLRRRAQGPADSDLLGELAASPPKIDHKQFTSAEDLRTRGLGKLTEAVSLLESKATPEEVETYRTFALDVAVHAAEADKSGGFLGVGGERVTAAETTALADVAAALGAEPPPPATPAT